MIIHYLYSQEPDTIFKTMIYDELPLPLVFYDDILKQDRFKENNKSDIFKLLALNDRLIPFQFRDADTQSLTSIGVYREDGTLLTNLQLNLFSSISISGFKYFIWNANQALKNTSGANISLPCDRYYLRANLTSKVYFSEIFTVIDNPLDYLMLEWTNINGDVDPVYYQSGYKSRLYIDTFITKGIPSIEINQDKDGFGNPVILSKKMVENYEISLELVPNYLLDAINFMSLHDKIFVRTKGNNRSGDMENTTIDFEQVERYSLFEVTVKFNQPNFFLTAFAEQLL